MYHLYILKCIDGSLYTGITVNLARRVKEHNGSEFGAQYTRGRRPVKLVFSKRFRNRSAAAAAEARVKKLTRQQKLAMLAYRRQE